MLISITDIIVQSIALYKLNAKRFATYALLIFVPGACITILANLLPIFIPSELSLGILGVSYLVYILAASILSFISFWFSIVFIRIVAKSYTGSAVHSIATELQEAKVIFWPAIGVSILTALAFLGGFLLLIVPGIIFGVWFAFAVYATVIDHHAPMQAMQESKKLVDGRWWPVFLRLLIPSLTFAIIIVVVRYILELPLIYVLEHTDPRTLLFVTWGMLAELMTSLIALLLAPLTTAVPTILYLELKKHPVVIPTPPKEA